MDISNKSLLLASKDKGVESIKYLLNREGADIGTMNNDGVTPLHNAARSNSSEVVKFLLDSGAGISAATSNSEMTALHCAARYNKNIEVVKLLLDSGADISAVNSCGHNFIFLAYLNSKEMFGFCIVYGYGVDEEVYDKLYGCKPFSVGRLVKGCLDTLNSEIKPAKH